MQNFPRRNKIVCMNEERFEKISVTLNSLARSLADLSASTQQGFADLERKIDAKIDSKLEEFAEMVGHGFADMGERIDSSEKRLGGTVSGLRQEMKAEFAIVNGRLDRSEFRWKDHEHRITALEGAH